MKIFLNKSFYLYILLTGLILAFSPVLAEESTGEPPAEESVTEPSNTDEQVSENSQSKPSQSEEPESEPVQGSPLGNLDFGVGGYMDAGRFQLDDPETATNGEFISRTGARWNITGHVTDNLDAMVNIHWLFWRNQATDLGLFHIAGIKFTSDLEAALQYNVTEDKFFKAGLFEYKYNTDSKHLGEYLLRSEVQPLFLESGQGLDLLRMSHTRVAGVQYNFNAGPLDNSALVYFEQTNMPVNDISAAVFTGLNSDLFEAQTGLALRRFGKIGVVKYDTTVGLAEQNESLGLNRTAITYMLRGNIKIMDDFKLYAEAAVLGFNNDTMWYDDITDRIPLMAGIDIPSGGFFSRLAFEFEYFKNPYKDQKYALTDVGNSKYSERPALLPAEYTNLPNYTRDDTKWSVYISKNLNPWINFHVRFANDHLRLHSWNKDLENDARPVTYTPKDWYVLARVEFHN